MYRFCHPLHNISMLVETSVSKLQWKIPNILYWNVLVSCQDNCLSQSHVYEGSFNNVLDVPRLSLFMKARRNMGFQSIMKLLVFTSPNWLPGLSLYGNGYSFGQLTRRSRNWIQQRHAKFLYIYNEYRIWICMLNLFQRCGGPLRLQNYGIKVKMKGHEDYLFSQTLCFGQILGIFRLYFD